VSELAGWLPVLAGLLGAGVLAGLLAGLLGVGGGIVVVPVLFLLFQTLGVSPASAMLVATSTSLLTIVPTSISSARAHHARGNIDLDLFRAWLPSMLAGVVLGSLAAASVNGLLLTAVFGTVAVAIALNTLLRPKAPPLREALPARYWQWFMAALIGAVSVMMGIGGGTLGVTAMTAFNVATHRAVGTAALFGLVISLPGALLMLLLPETPADAPPGAVGAVNLPGFLALVPMTMLMAPVGVRLGSRLEGVTLKRIFAVFLLVVGGRMLWQLAPPLVGALE
jgi:uncharacterized membrane protein YfcA